MTEISNPLFERWPQIAGSIPYIRLGTWPTPVERLDGIDERDEPIWVKREDLSSPLYGGNKVRKLEFLLCGPGRTVLTFGATGSHHVLATAIHAGKCGHLSIAALVPQKMSEHHEKVGELVASRCDFVLKADRLSAVPKELVRVVAAASRLSKMKGLKGLTVIPPGASSARGTLGYVAAGMEIASQVRAGACPKPTRVYVALGTGGTAAGLALGLALEDLDSEVVAVRVASRVTGNRFFLNMLANKSMKLLQKAGIDMDMPGLNIRVDHRFIGSGYASITREALDSVEDGRRVGLLLETTYTGKAMAAMLADRREHPNLGPVMFVDTYGPIDGIDKTPTACEEKER